MPPPWQRDSGDAARKLVVVGAGESAEIAYEYFTHDSPYEVVAFAVEAQYLDRKEVEGLPVVPLDEIAERYPPDDHLAFVAVSSTQLNRLRRRLFDA
ncbi:MAG: sugar O-acyltransferase, partial [Actinobacteria bacterium]|nr:sugar O-acyltransferase [Actinomycetota bacterium]